MIELNEILDTPMYYLKDMMIKDNNSYVLFYYGPYLALTSQHILQIQKESIQNPLLRYMTDIGQFIKVCANGYTFKKARRKVIKILNEAYVRSDEFYPCIKRYGESLLINISSYKKENQITSEAAILNYSPIVGYSPSFLRKAELSSLHVKENKKEEEKERLRKHMIELLKENPYEILLNAEKEIKNGSKNCDNLHYKYHTYFTDEVNHVKAKIPQIMDDSEKNTLRAPVSFLYYVYAYLYAKLECNETDDIYEINQICNKITKDGIK